MEIISLVPMRWLILEGFSPRSPCFVNGVFISFYCSVVSPVWLSIDTLLDTTSTRYSGFIHMFSKVTFIFDRGRFRTAEHCYSVTAT